jgi:hypothetical protein
MSIEISLENECEKECEKDNFVYDNCILTDTNSELPYHRRKDEEKKSIAYGQRKLLLTLLSFVSEYIVPRLKELKQQNLSPIIVYAGAAPGVNIQLVAEYYSQFNFEWHLYDPGTFKITTDLSKKFIIYNKKFDDNVAKFWAQNNKGNIFFISDIRTADYTKCKDLEENEHQILNDMNLQKHWVEIIKPIVSHLKFRLPYSIESTPKEIIYFDGVIYFQPYSPQTSTETRLVVTDPFSTKSYSCQKYEAQLFYHNVITREQKKYQNEFADGIELIDDHDSCLEIWIWSKFLESIGKEVNKENILRFSQEATIKLSKGKKGIDTLKYLRDHPQAIKKRNFNKS